MHSSFILIAVPFIFNHPVLGLVYEVFHVQQHFTWHPTPIRCLLDFVPKASSQGQPTDPEGACRGVINEQEAASHHVPLKSILKDGVRYWVHPARR